MNVIGMALCTVLFNGYTLTSCLGPGMGNNIHSVYNMSSGESVQGITFSPVKFQFNHQYHGIPSKNRGQDSVYSLLTI
jgi:hypothetical protein